jgi:hypothetical protein
MSTTAGSGWGIIRGESENPIAALAAPPCGAFRDFDQQSAGRRSANASAVLRCLDVPTGQASKIRVLLADDHATLRDALTLLINGQPDMTVCGSRIDIVRIALLQGWLSQS